MSLGLPDFTARGAAAPAPGWRALRLAGILVLAYVLMVGILEWREARAADLALERAREGAAEVLRSADETRRALRKSPDLLVAAASVESSPGRVLADLTALLPDAVSITGLKVEYLPDGAARAEFTVVAGGPSAYDRFLAALSRSSAFSEIKPGAESRPGLVKATVSANHHPVGAAR